MRIPVIAGPTASGKSEAALTIAMKTGNVEIISADAFQVYRGMDVGTAKPSLEERKKVPHHLVDILEPYERYTAGLFRAGAERLAGEIISRGAVPIIAGGTGLYIQSATEGIFDCPRIAPSVRQYFADRYEKEGLAALYEELRELDPVYALRIDPHDRARIMRALEVCRGLGISFTEAHEKYRSEPGREYDVYVLAPPRDALYEKINERTVRMWKNGWPEETARLLENGASLDWPCFRAIGYRETALYLTKGGSEEAVIREIAKKTRHFAKRQYTWFKRVGEARFFEDRQSLVRAVLRALDNGAEEI